MKDSYLWFGAIACTLTAGAADAQVSAPVRPAPTYRNVVAGGVSYGVQNDRDADFWGFAADYSRTLSERWLAGASLNWDRETEKRVVASDRSIDSFTLVGTVSYALNSWMSITTGLGKGFADTNNPMRAMRFTNGDLATGVALGLVTPGLPQFVRDTIGFSIAYEYNVTNRETSLSFDASFGWSF